MKRRGWSRRSVGARILRIIAGLIWLAFILAIAIILGISPGA